MNPQILLRTVVVCYFLGASEVSMAQCPNGLIQETTMDGDLIIEGRPCSVMSSTIKGDVIVMDSSDVTVLSNWVGGKVRVVRSEGREGEGVVSVIANTVLGGNVMVSDHAIANVIENETLTGSIRVYGNNKALVHKNIAAYNLVCRENGDLSAFVNFARETLSCE